MKYGICKLSVLPGRIDSSDKSEMITQVIFGEVYKILEEKAKWSKIRLNDDNYECWIDKKQVCEITKEQYQQYVSDKKLGYSLDIVSRVNLLDNKTHSFPILLGSNLPFCKKNNFELDGISYQLEGKFIAPDNKKARKNLTNVAMMFLHAPYLWGGKTPFGIDCSGFVQMTYKLLGIKMPRDAYQQAEIGQTLSFVEEALEGDLAFFDNSEGQIIHVGIILKNNHIIHASGKVRIDRIDHQGIYNVDTKTYSHKLRLIKSVMK
jgi:gamma-D-glutamyl-L-lysine dipeptidyl-peptidase